MLQEYSVFYNGEIVGNVEIELQGLYLNIQCNCSLPKGPIYILWVKTDDYDEKIGIFLPTSSGYSLQTRIPVKRFSIKNATFYVSLRDVKKTEMFYLVEDKPFPYLGELKNAYFHYVSGKPVISLTKRDFQTNGDYTDS